MGDKAERCLTCVTEHRGSLGSAAWIWGHDATSTETRGGSQEPRERREDKGSSKVNTDSELRLDMVNENGNEGEYKCCGKSCGSLKGLKIHQGKVCRKKVAQQCRSSDQMMLGRDPLESNHSGIEPTADQVRMKDYFWLPFPIKWPKANETAVYNQFDLDENTMLGKLKGNTEQKLERLAEVIYEEGERRFGLEKNNKRIRTTGKDHAGDRRRSK